MTCSNCRRLYEFNLLLDHHHNQVPSDQFAQFADNRLDLNLPPRDVLVQNFCDAQFADNRLDLNLPPRDVLVQNFCDALHPQSHYPDCGMPMLHQSSSRSGEVVEQAGRKRDCSWLTNLNSVSDNAFSLYDPRYADIGLPVDPMLRALKANPNFITKRAANDAKRLRFWWGK